MDLSLETLKNKNFLGAIGALLVSAYLILTVLEEFVLLGLYDDPIVLVIMIIVLVMGLLFMGLGLYEYYKGSKKIIALIVFAISILAIVTLISYQALRLFNIITYYVPNLFGYLGTVIPALSPISKILGFSYAEINTTVNWIFGLYTFTFAALMILLGLNSVLKRADRVSNKLSLIAGLLTLITGGMFIAFFVIYYMGRTFTIDFAFSRAVFGMVEDPNATIDLFGFKLSWGMILSGIALLLVDPKISGLLENWLLYGMLPLGIVTIINAISFLKEVK